MSSKKKKVAATAVAVVLVLALGLAGTFARAIGDDSSGEIEGEIDAGAVLHDDYASKQVWDAQDEKDRNVFVENSGDTDLYLRVRLNEFMEYAGKSVIAGTVRGNKDTWKTHVPATATTPQRCNSGIHKYFNLNMDGSTAEAYKSYDKASKTGTKNVYTNANAATPLEKVTTNATTQTCTVMTMKEYVSQMNAGTYDTTTGHWIIDDTDDGMGYAYWSQRLSAGQATGLLMTAVKNNKTVDDTYYYGIHVKMEGVTESDLTYWFSGYKNSADENPNRTSKAAEQMLKRISPSYVEVSTLAAAAAKYDVSGDGFLDEEELAAYDASGEGAVTPTP